MMTADISTSFLCGDVAYPGLEDFTGLALVDFAFVPHFDNSEAMTAGLKAYSTKFDGPVYGVPDGCGIVVEGGSARAMGPIWQVVCGQLIDCSSQVTIPPLS